VRWGQFAKKESGGGCLRTEKWGGKDRKSTSDSRNAVGRETVSKTGEIDRINIKGLKPSTSDRLKIKTRISASIEYDKGRRCYCTM